MPPAIEYSVRKQNIKFMHNRNQFSAEYFQFIKKLVSCNPHNINRQNMNEKLVSCNFMNNFFLILYIKHMQFLEIIFAESRAGRTCNAICTIGIEIPILYRFSY